MLCLNTKTKHSDIEFLDKFSDEFESLRVVIDLFRIVLEKAKEMLTLKSNSPIAIRLNKRCLNSNRLPIPASLHSIP